MNVEVNSELKTWSLGGSRVWRNSKILENSRYSRTRDTRNTFPFPSAIRAWKNVTCAQKRDSRFLNQRAFLPAEVIFSWGWSRVIHSCYLERPLSCSEKFWSTMLCEKPETLDPRKLREILWSIVSHAWIELKSYCALLERGRSCAITALCVLRAFSAISSSAWNPVENTRETTWDLVWPGKLSDLSPHISSAHNYLACEQAPGWF